MASSKVVLPADVKRVSYLINWQLLEYTLKLPEGYTLGITRFHKESGEDIPTVFNRLLQKVQQVCFFHSYMDGVVPYDNMWRCERIPTGLLTIGVPVGTTLGPGQIWQGSFSFKETADMVAGHRYMQGGNQSGLALFLDTDGNGNVRANVRNDSGGTKEISPNGNHLTVSIKTINSPNFLKNVFPYTNKYTFLSQWIEDGFLMSQTEQTNQKVYSDRAIPAGATSPLDTNIGGDYFNTGAGSKFRFSNYAERKEQLMSVSNARKNYMRNSTSDPLVDHPYHTDYRNYRNMLSNFGYLDSYQYSVNGDFLFYHLHEKEKFHIAEPDRKVIMMGWTETEGVHSRTIGEGAWYRLKFPQGDVLRRQKIQHSQELMLTQVLFHFLTDPTITFWHSNIVMNKDLSRWANYSLAPTRFIPNGETNWIPWQEGNSAHPQFNRPAGWEGQFPEAPQYGENGVWLAAKMLESITTQSDRFSQSRRYAEFSYSVNGGAVQNGYASGRNTPVQGTQGAELSRVGLSNPGNYNIADIKENAKPIVIITSGSDGHAVWIKNMICGITDIVTYNVVISGMTHVIVHKGRKSAIFKITTASI